MSKLNPQNERIKRDFLRHQKNALGKSEATLDAMRKALVRFEDYTGHRDFKTFRREQAIGFKERLAETDGQRSGETLSRSTQASTLAALKDFFRWLAWQPGFKSKIHVPDIEYFSPSNKDLATAKAAKLRDFPSLEQVRAVDPRHADGHGCRTPQPRLDRFRHADWHPRPRVGLALPASRRPDQVAAACPAGAGSGPNEVREGDQHLLLSARRRSDGDRRPLDRRTAKGASVRP